MSLHRPLRRRPLGLILIAAVLGVAVFVPVATIGAPASAATANTAACTAATAPTEPPSPDTLYGEGGSPAEPIINELIDDDTVGLGTMSASYFDSNINTAGQDFAIGNSDFGLSELPLSSADAATAAANCRTFAYVPFAAQGVAIAAILICNPTVQASDLQAAFCANVQLTAQQVEGLFTGHIATWSDASNLGDIYPTPPSGVLGPLPISPEFKTVSAEIEVDPTADNEALESYFDNDPVAGPLYQGWAAGVIAGGSGTPSVLWPTETGVSGGDLGLANQLMPLDEVTLQPDPNPSDWGIGDVGALPVDWLSSPRFIPAVAIQNAQGTFVLPTQSAEQAAVNDASIDPKTNLVSFLPNGGSDAGAYPMMMMSYLVVPTTGLSAAKATALSQFITFVLSPEGQKDIEALGGVPVTPAMAAAGQAVATTVAAEAGPATTTTTTTTTTPGGTNSTPPSSANSNSNGSSPGSGSDASFASDGSGTGSGTDDGVSLAMTGSDPLPIGCLGLFLVVVGFAFRRRLRRSFRALR